jgi:hypothetical protein
MESNNCLREWRSDIYGLSCALLRFWGPLWQDWRIGKAEYASVKRVESGHQSSNEIESRQLHLFIGSVPQQQSMCLLPRPIKSLLLFRRRTNATTQWVFSSCVDANQEPTLPKNGSTWLENWIDTCGGDYITMSEEEGGGDCGAFIGNLVDNCWPHPTFQRRFDTGSIKSSGQCSDQTQNWV